MNDYRFHGGINTVSGDVDTIYMHGGVLNTSNVGRVIQYGGILNRGAADVYVETQPKVIYRDRVVYRDKVVYRDRVKEKIVYRDRRHEEYDEQLKTAKQAGAYWLNLYETTKNENDDLRKQLADTERQQLLCQIDDLRERLARALQRERVAVHARHDAEREARILRSQIWDDYKPTKEACKRVYENLKGFLDCEDEGGDGIAG